MDAALVQAGRCRNSCCLRNPGMRLSSDTDPPPGAMPALARQASEAAASNFENSTHVVYGVGSNPAEDGEIARFRIIHVYKGDLQTGTSMR